MQKFNTKLAAQVLEKLAKFNEGWIPRKPHEPVRAPGWTPRKPHEPPEIRAPQTSTAPAAKKPVAPKPAPAQMMPGKTPLKGPLG